MLKQLKFVQGAVSKKDFNPVLQHFSIREGFVTGSNGWLTIQAPLPVDIDASPKATAFVKALEGCTGPISLHKTPAGKLAVCSNNFKSYVDCIDDVPFSSMPTLNSDMFTVQGDFIGMIKQLAPFVNDCEAGAHEWTNSLLMRTDGCCIATNGVVLVQKYAGALLPLTHNLCIPYHTIRELLRIKENPVSIGWDDKGIMFNYADGMWMHTTQRHVGWSTDTDAMFPSYTACPPVHAGLFEALHKIKPFVDEVGHVYFRDGAVCSSCTEGSGTAISLDAFTVQAGFTLRHVLSLETVAETIDFAAYPKPCVFYGPNLRGLIVGLV